MTRHVLAACTVLAAILAGTSGCSSGPTGIYEIPVLIPIVDSVTTPDGAITAGVPVQFTVNWRYGRMPCEVKWVFAEQPEALEKKFTTSEQTQTAEVTLTTVGVAAGTVTVTDAGGNSDSQFFDYEVVAAPAG